MEPPFEESGHLPMFERNGGVVAAEAAEPGGAAAAEEDSETRSFEIVSYPASAPDGEVAADSDWEEDATSASGDSDEDRSSNGSGEVQGEAGPLSDDLDETDPDPDNADDEPSAAARTEVIRVGAGGDSAGAPRRGWWQRFMN